jgi:hypothetical protein
MRVDMNIFRRLTDRARQLLTPGPLAAALRDLDPLQRDIIVGLLSGDDHRDDMLAERHGTTEEEVRRQRHTARAKLAAAVKASA